MRSTHRKFCLRFSENLMEYTIGAIPELFIKNAIKDPVISKYFKDICTQKYISMMTTIIQDMLDNVPINLYNICEIHKNVNISDEDHIAWTKCFEKTCLELNIESANLTKKLDPILQAIKTHNSGSANMLIDKIVEDYKAGKDILQDLYKLQNKIHKT